MGVNCRLLTFIALAGLSCQSDPTGPGLPPPAPVLVRPAHGTLDESTNPTMQWTTAKWASYELQISVESTFATTVIDDSGLAASSYRVGDLANRTRYFWRMRAVNVIGSSPWSTIWKFTTGSRCTGREYVSHGGERYATIQIYSQCWLARNLNIGEKMRGDQAASRNETVEKYCYGNADSNCATYGGLYSWNEAMQYNSTAGTRGICPVGWHIPTYPDLYVLASDANGNGHALLEGSGAGANSTGFSGLLGGLRRAYPPGFESLEYAAHYWTSTKYDDLNAVSMLLFREYKEIAFNAADMRYGFSVRCIAD